MVAIGRAHKSSVSIMMAIFAKICQYKA
jgi:hypothetical protein